VETTTGDPSANVRQRSLEDNSWYIDFVLPRGKDGLSIDIQGGIYSVDDLPDFDETGVNKAFIVADTDEDNAYELYIRGEQAVIASLGGPWTVIEDWQGVQGYSMRYLKGRLIQPTGEAIRVTKDDAAGVFVHSRNIQDGDLALDRNGLLGIVGSATDDSGDYTVTYVGTLFPRVDGPEMLKSDCTVDDMRETVNELISALTQAMILAYDLPSALDADCTSNDMRTAINELIYALQSQGIL